MGGIPGNADVPVGMAGNNADGDTAGVFSPRRGAECAEGICDAIYGEFKDL